MTFFRLPPAYCLTPFWGGGTGTAFLFFTPNIRTYGAKSESAAQGHTVTDAKHRKGACCRQFVISCKIYVINIKIETE